MGDRLNLREWCPKLDHYTGRSILVVITYMTDFAQYPGTVVMGIATP